MISNRFLVLISVFLALCACKTQSTIHYPQSTIHDSVSITYKQGKEQPTPTGVRGAAIESRKNSSVPAAWCPRQTGKPYLGKGQTSTREASVFEGLLSQRTNKQAVPPTPTIRVDTVFVERWHTEIVESQKKKVESAKPDKPIPRFYKDCTLGFWVLLILFLGRIAFRLTRLLYLRR